VVINAKQMIVINLKKKSKESLDIDVDKIESYRVFAGVATLVVGGVVYRITNVDTKSVLVINGTEVHNVYELLDEIASNECT